jgi:hypothetical protein
MDNSSKNAENGSVKPERLTGKINGIDTTKTGVQYQCFACNNFAHNALIQAANKVQPTLKNINPFIPNCAKGELIKVNNGLAQWLKKYIGLLHANLEYK